MKWDTREPCASCPYRKDAPREMWHAEEFKKLLAADANEFGGAMFGCHKFRNHPEQAQVCGGWLLDQKRRGCPSIQLRLVLIHKPEAVKALEEITDGGHRLYASIAAMCRANGIQLRRTR
jgi:hypothetical protein